MIVHRFSSVDGFVIFDLGDDAPHVGPVRLAKKVLQSTSTDLARFLTYRNAVYGASVGGAAVGVSLGDGDRAEVVASLVGELGELAVDRRLFTDAGTGIGPNELPAAGDDVRGSSRSAVVDGLSLEGRATAAGIVAATRSASPGATLDGRTIAVASSDPVALHAASLAAATGAVILEVDDALAAAADVLWVGGAAGVIDHESIAGVVATTIVPVAPLVITARGFAVARRSGITVVPDIVSCGGAVAAWDETIDHPGVLSRADDTVTEVTTEVLGHPEGPALGSFYRAEAFLRTWRTELPFGRPFAP